MLQSTTQNLPNRLRDRDRVLAELGLPEFLKPEDFYLSSAASTSTRDFCSTSSRPKNSRARFSLYLQCGDFDIDLRTMKETPKTLVSEKGYRRIVFGDHGPYLEFTAEQIHLPSFPFVRRKPHHAFYDEHWFMQDKFLKSCLFLSNREKNKSVERTSASRSSGTRKATQNDLTDAEWAAIDDHAAKAIAAEEIMRPDTVRPADRRVVALSPPRSFLIREREFAYLYAQKRTVASKPNPPHTGKFWCDNDRPEGYADYQVGFFYLECSKEVVLVLRDEVHFETKNKNQNEHPDPHTHLDHVVEDQHISTNAQSSASTATFLTQEQLQEQQQCSYGSAESRTKTATETVVKSGEDMPRKEKRSRWNRGK
ncbi:unnamed protein product, partial [Amoebophrya sp. A120]|eukprot:GSA120T00000048001.1